MNFQIGDTCICTLEGERRFGQKGKVVRLCPKLSSALELYSDGVILRMEDGKDCLFCDWEIKKEENDANVPVSDTPVPRKRNRSRSATMGKDI